MVAAPAKESSSGPTLPTGGRRVLIIEDNKDAADSLREALTFSGHEVEVAFDGPTGIDAARDFHPEIIICDIGLPGMDGYSVARVLRSDEALKDIYLIALTGYAAPEDVERARTAGFDRHVSKPSSLETLNRLLDEAPAK